MEQDLNFFNQLYKKHEQLKSPIQAVRYLSEPMVNELNHKISHQHQILNEGNSVLGRVISSYVFGNGPCRVLIWSQMHGNESTTTKAVYDLIYYLLSSDFKKSQIAEILNELTIKVIPILNPDGSFAWTRVNANDVDLNRDAKAQSQPETQLLINVIKDFKPDFCFNMHDQRSIFEAEKSFPATISFLSASYNASRDFNQSRLKSMSVIHQMIKFLQIHIPNEVGRYDDAFNINCFGDYLHSLEIPTILVEAGQSLNDYTRETTRKLCFVSLIKALSQLSKISIDERTIENYLIIPENTKNFTDVLIKNYSSSEYDQQDVSIRFQECLTEDSRILFKPYIDQIGDLSELYAHQVIDAKKSKVNMKFEKLERQSFVKSLQVNENDFVLKFKI